MIVVKTEDLHEAARSRPPDYLADVYAHAEKITPHYVMLTVANYDQLCQKYRDAYVSIYDQIAAHARLAQNAAIYGDKHSPGKVLLRFLSKFGFNIRADCPCRKKIEIVNARGHDWAAANIVQIVDWLDEEAEKWGVAANRPFNENLVRRALEFAHRHEPPQTQFDTSEQHTAHNG